MHSDAQQMYPLLQGYISDLTNVPISPDRKVRLDILVKYIQSRVDNQLPIHLNFICTHNSRRSQFGQVWAYVAGVHYGLKVHTYSGGVEVTACNERTIAALVRAGFQVTSTGDENPHYALRFSPEGDRDIHLFSKLYNDPVNPKDAFAAIMTCAEADTNCPFIPGVEQRISVTYEDPKVSDDSPQEHQVYDERCKQIASEMFYVLSRVKIIA